MPVEAGHRHWIGSTGNGRSPIISGRRQPSSDGTSRMNREVHVRICERLGVKFPGPTRHSRRSLLTLWQQASEADIGSLALLPRRAVIGSNRPAWSPPVGAPGLRPVSRDFSQFAFAGDPALKL